jgi:hypothetical protein
VNLLVQVNYMKTDFSHRHEGHKQALGSKARVSFLA